MEPAESIETFAVVCPASPNGAITLVWVAEAYNTGAGMPLKNTRIPASCVGIRPVLSKSNVVSVLGPIRFPYRATTPPGVTALVV